MADPLSIAGAALGAASLGIQLYSCITTYLDAIRCREQELKAVRQRVSIFTSSIAGVDAAEERLKQASSSTRPALEECIRVCKEELRALLQFLTDFDNGNVVAQSGLRGSIKGKAKALSYPFQKNKIEALEQRLNQTNAILCTNLQTAGIDATTQMTKDISSIQDISSRTVAKCDIIAASMDSIYAKTEVTHSKVEELSTGVESMHLQVSGMRSDMRRIDEQQLDKLDQMLTLLNVISKKQDQRSFISAEGASEVIRRLDSPSSLRDIAQVAFPPAHELVTTALQNGKQRHADLEIKSSECTCLRSSTCTYNSLNIGIFALTTHNRMKHCHDTSCPLAKMKNKHRQIELKINVLRNIVSWRIAFMFSLTAGGGGYSLARTLECVRVVDRDSHPAFQVGTLMLVSTFHVKDGDQQSEIRAYVLSILTDLIRKGRACIEDVDEDGVGIIQQIIVNCAFLSRSRDMIYILTQFLSTLNEWGLRKTNLGPSTHLVYGINKLLDIVHYNEAIKVGDRSPCGSYLVRKLHGLFEGFGEQWLDPCGLEKVHGDIACILMLLMYTDNLSGIERGPFFQILYDRNEARLQDLISRQPECLAETWKFGHNDLRLGCLAMTVFWLAGQQILLSAFLRYGLPTGHGWIVHQAIEAAYRIYWQLDSEHEEKTLENNAVCSHDNCVKILQPLLKLGFSFRQPDFVLKTFRHVRCRTSRKAMISRIKQQRDELKALAIGHFPTDLVERFQLHRPIVLDSTAGEVVYELEQMGIIVPEALWVPRHLPSLYTFLSQPECGDSIDVLLEHLWNSGFRELSFESMATSKLFSSKNGQCSSWTLWHLHKGIDFDRTYQNFHATHWIAAKVGISIRPSHLRGATSELLDKVAKWARIDTCKCHCSPMGCTASAVFLHKLYNNLYKKIGWWNEDFEIVIDHLDSSHEVQLAIIRMLTFEELGMAHVCCHRDMSTYPEKILEDPLDDEEVREFWEEDQTLISTLEELMLDFEDKLSNKEPGTSLTEFIHGYWEQRMRAATIGDSDFDNIVAGARDIGVEMHVNKGDKLAEVRPAFWRSLERTKALGWKRLIDDAAEGNLTASMLREMSYYWY